MKTEGEKSSFLKCIPKSNVILKIFWVLVFGIGIWYLAYPRDRSFIAKVVIKSHPIAKIRTKKIYLFVIC